MTQQKKRFLFVLTSHGELGDTGEQTGFHYSEMTDPYYMLSDHKVDVDLASIKGGEPPADPKSLEKPADTVKRFREDSEAMAKLKATKKIDAVNLADYEGIYLPGGHGCMWDFPDNAALKSALEKIWKQGKIIASICHGAAALVNLQDEEKQPFVKNHRLNSYTDEEERKAKKDKIVPFLLESRLREQGAIFEHADPSQPIVVDDGRLITGQNPASAGLVANTILRAIGISPYISQDEKSKDEEEAA